jgi:hypothetical protein
VAVRFLLPNYVTLAHAFYSMTAIRLGSGRAICPKLLRTITRENRLLRGGAWPAIGGQVADQGRGAADRGERREVAGAVAQCLIGVEPPRVGAVVNVALLRPGVARETVSARIASLSTELDNADGEPTIHVFMDEIR